MQRMKRMKTILALILVFAFVLSFMAMSASAATTVVQPRASCSKCGGYAFRYERVRNEKGKYVWQENVTCSSASFPHAHYKVPTTQYTYCATCGNHIDTTNYGATYCPYAGYLS